MPSSDRDNDSGWNKKLITAVSKKQGKKKTISEEDRIRQIKSCLDKGADINTVDKCGNTALHTAVKRGYKIIVEFLLETGARTDISNNKGETALTSAENLGEPAIASIWNTPSTSRTSDFPLNSPSKKLNRKRTADTEVKNLGESVIKTRLIGVPQSDRHSDAASVEQRSNQKRTANNKLDEYGKKICGMTLTDVPQPGLNRKAADDKTYPVSKGSLKDSLHGNVYQLKHLMLILHRARTMGYSFRLATEIGAAEKFDDVVLRYTDSDGHEAYRFVQAKHKQDETKEISASDLLNKKNGDFSLLKYFTSWQKIKKHPDFAGSGSKHFVLCTNMGLAIDDLKKKNIIVSEVEESDDFLKVTNRTRQPPRYKLLGGDPSGLWDVWKSASDLHRLASKLAEHVVHDEDIHLDSKIIENYHLALAKEVVDVKLKKFSGNFLRNNGLSGKAAEFRKILFLYTKRLLSEDNQSEQNIRKVLGERSLKLSETFGVGPKSPEKPDQTRCTELPDDAEITRFLDEFILAVNQPNEVELGEIMKREISDYGRFDLPDAGFVSNAFQTHMLDWFKAKQGKFLEKEDVDDFFSGMEDKVFSIKIKALSSEYPEQLKKLDIHFNNCENTELQNFIEQPDDGSNHRVLEMICPDHTLLTALQVRQTLAQQQNCAQTEGFICIRLERLSTQEIIDLILGAFKSRRNHNLLVVDCETRNAKQHFETLWNRLRDVMSKNVRKRMIVITQKRKDLGTQFKFDRRKYYVKNVDRSFDKLMKDSQKKLLNKKVTKFQGQNHETSFGELLGIRDYDNLGKDEIKDLSEIMDSDTLVKFISEDAIQIGSDLEGLNEMVAHYVDRTICRHVVIKDDILKDKQMPDVLAISGIVREFSDKLVSLGKTAPRKGSLIIDSLTVSGIRKDRKGVSTKIRANSTTAQSPTNFITLDSGREKEQFNDLCARNGSRNIHWLKKEAGKYKWKQSQGDITYLVQYKEASESDDHDDRTGATYLSEDQLTAHDAPVIISGTAGMGKSIMLTHFAQKLKEKEPGMMVLKIELNHRASALENVKNKSSYNLDSIDGAVEFLVKELLNRETKLTQKVFVNMIRKKHKLALIFDGFDEISPTYEETVIQILYTLCEYGIKKLIITTRPHTRAMLERKLNAFSHELQPFSQRAQREFFIEFWTTRFQNSRHDFEKNTEHRIQKYAEAITEKLGESIQDHENKFTGNPLQARLVAEIFENHLGGGRENFHSCEEFIHSKVDWPKFPEKIDLIYLYEHFVKKKFEFFFEKRRVDSANVAVIEDRKLRYKMFMNKHKRLALDTLFDKDKVRELLLSQGDASHRLLESTGPDIVIERDGIVTQFINGRPHFGHRTYAEYFAAKTFSEMLEQQDQNESLQRIFVAEVLLGDNYKTIRDFMNWLLSEKDDNAFSYGSWKSHLNKHRSKLDETIFHVAAAEGNVHIIRLFLNCLGTNPCDREAFVHLEDSSGRTAVHRACECRHVEGIKLLIENTEFDVNCKDRYSETPLTIAAEYGNLDVVKCLIENRANVDLQDKDGYTPLCIAAENGHLDVVKCLLENRANVDLQDKDGYTPLYIAAENGHLDVVKCLIENRANVDLQFENGYTPLCVAAHEGKLDVLECLLENRANLDLQFKDGYTPLCVAAQEGKLDVVKCLLENRANVDLQDKDGYTPLYIAAENGHLDVVKCLIENRANVDLQFENGYPPLCGAARGGKLDVLECLLENRANVNLQDKDGYTPLCIAAEYGHLDVVKCLLENRANVNLQDKEGYTPLFIAAENGHLDVVKCLLENRANVDLQFENGYPPLCGAARGGKLDVLECLLENRANVNLQDKDGYTPLCIAAENGHLDVVKCLLENRANVDLQDKDGYTPLYIAAENGHLDVVKCLIENRANVDLQFENGYTPLCVAAHEGKLDVVKCLLENRANLDLQFKDGYTPLCVAAQEGKLDVVKCLLENRANVDLQDKDGYTPLYIAAENGHLDVVKCLLENRANVNLQDKDGYTPLCIAAENGHLDVVKCLLENRANVDLQDKDGYTPLYIAAENGHLDVVKCLIENRANVDLQFENGYTPLCVAAHEGKLDVLECLLENRANLDLQFKDGYTPLCVAAQEGKLDVVKCLLENRANVDLQDKDGYTPLYIAAENGHLDVVKCLIENRANVDLQFENGYPPLCGAARGGKLDVLECLLENRANVNLQDKDGDTPLFIAAENGHLDVLKCLLENRANVDLQDKDGCTPLYAAAQEGKLDVVKCLLENQANVDSQNKNTSTPLYIAAQKGKLDVVKCLLENRANVDLQDKDGYTPLYIATENGHLDVVKCLIENRANVDFQFKDGSTSLHAAIYDKRRSQL